MIWLILVISSLAFFLSVWALKCYSGLVGKVDRHEHSINTFKGNVQRIFNEQQKISSRQTKSKDYLDPERYPSVKSDLQLMHEQDIDEILESTFDTKRD